MYGVRPGVEASQLYYNSIVNLYAEWGVDFIKCDDICRMDAASSKAEIEMLHKAIEQCGRNIVLSLSPGPALVSEADFYHENANMWRITDDFWDDWKLLFDMFDRCKKWEGLAKDGGYPDGDMLPVGKIGKGFDDERDTRFTKDEQRTMMTLWAMVRSPLMLGAQMPLLDDWTLSLLTNKNILSLLSQTKDAKEFYRDEKRIVWTSSHTEANIKYIAVFNISENDDVFTPNEYVKGSSKLLNLWENESMNAEDTITLPPHGVCIFSIQ